MPNEPVTVDGVQGVYDPVDVYEEVGDNLAPAEEAHQRSLKQQTNKDGSPVAAEGETQSFSDAQLAERQAAMEAAAGDDTPRKVRSK